MPDKPDSEVEQNRQFQSETLDLEPQRLVEDIAILVVRQFRRDRRGRLSNAPDSDELTAGTEVPNQTS